jgi:polyisoprenoid-binding protein YceI
MNRSNNQPEESLGQASPPSRQSGLGHAQMTHWVIDPAHSEIEFAIRHLMISTIKGRFNDFSGSIQVDEEHLAVTRVEVEIDAASIDTGQEQRDFHLRSGDFFDVESYPEIRFVSRQVDSLGANHFRITGDLRLHGVTRPVVLDATVEGTGQDPWGNTRASFTATTQINRYDFGLTWNQPLDVEGVMIGDTVRIYLNIQAVKQR